MSFPKVLAALLLAAALAACSSHKSHNPAAGIATGSPAPALDQSTPVSGASAGNGGAMAGNAAGAASAAPAAAPVPAGLKCGSAQPVWVNKRSHVYHEPTDPLYGRTKHGAYLCPGAALAAGYHKAGGRHHHHRAHTRTPTT